MRYYTLHRVTSCAYQLRNTYVKKREKELQSTESSAERKVVERMRNAVGGETIRIIPIAVN